MFLLIFLINFSGSVAQERAKGFSSIGKIGEQIVEKSLIKSEDFQFKVEFRDTSDDGILSEGETAYVVASIINKPDSEIIRPRFEMIIKSNEDLPDVYKIKWCENLEAGESGLITDKIVWNQNYPTCTVTYFISVRIDSYRKIEQKKISFDILGSGSLPIEAIIIN